MSTFASLLLWPRCMLASLTGPRRPQASSARRRLMVETVVHGGRMRLGGALYSPCHRTIVAFKTHRNTHTGNRVRFSAALRQAAATVEPRGAAGEAADRPASTPNKRIECAVATSRLKSTVCTWSTASSTSLDSCPRSAPSSNARQAQLGLRARQQLLVPKLIAPAPMAARAAASLNTAPSTSGVLAPAAQNVAARAMACAASRCIFRRRPRSRRAARGTPRQAGIRQTASTGARRSPRACRAARARRPSTRRRRRLPSPFNFELASNRASTAFAALAGGACATSSRRSARRASHQSSTRSAASWRRAPAAELLVAAKAPLRTRRRGVVVRGDDGAQPLREVRPLGPLQRGHGGRDGPRALRIGPVAGARRGFA